MLCFVQVTCLGFCFSGFNQSKILIYLSYQLVNLFWDILLRFSLPGYFFLLCIGWLLCGRRSCLVILYIHRPPCVNRRCVNREIFGNVFISDLLVPDSEMGRTRRPRHSVFRTIIEQQYDDSARFRLYKGVKGEV